MDPVHQIRHGCVRGLESRRGKSKLLPYVDCGGRACLAWWGGFSQATSLGGASPSTQAA